MFAWNVGSTVWSDLVDVNCFVVVQGTTRPRMPPPRSSILFSHSLTSSPLSSCAYIPRWAYSWDEKTAGLNVLMYAATREARDMCCFYLPAQCMTPCLHWQPVKNVPPPRRPSGRRAPTPTSSRSDARSSVLKRSVGRKLRKLRCQHVEKDDAPSSRARRIAFTPHKQRTASSSTKQRRRCVCVCVCVCCRIPNCLHAAPNEGATVTTA